MFCCLVLQNWPHFSPQKTRSPCRTGTSRSLSNLKNQRVILPSISVYIYLCQSLNANLKISGRDSCPLPPVCRSCSPCTSPLVSCVDLLITMINISIINVVNIVNIMNNNIIIVSCLRHYLYHQRHHQLTSVITNSPSPSITSSSLWTHHGHWSAHKK